MESSHCRGPRNNYPARTVIRKSESGRVSLDSLRGVLNGDRGEGEGRILRDATLRLRQEKGPRRAGPRLHSCGGEGEWSKPERVVGQARGSCLRRWSTLPAASRHANIDYVLPLPYIYLYIYIYSFSSFSSVHSKLAQGKVVIVMARCLRSPRDRGKSRGGMA